MGRRRKKLHDDKNDHLSTNLYIQHFPQCQECPFKVYAKNDDKIVFGIGNIFANTIIILSYYSTYRNHTNSILDIIKDIYKSITDRDILEDCYITRYIKCFENSEYEINDIAAKACSIHLIYEINRIKPKKIISFSSSFEHILIENGIKHISIINPYVMKYNNQELKDKFIEQFKSAINDS